MAFRRRNVGIQSSSSQPPKNVQGGDKHRQALPGARPSPLTGQPTTSTGIHTLDSHLGGHAGLALGSLLLIEESGTTDFAGALLKFFAAEGIVQGHHIHIVGVGEQWSRELPGLIGTTEMAEQSSTSEASKMKIAYRYERLGQHDAAPNRPSPQRGPVVSASVTGPQEVFCHAFDLAKKLVTPAGAKIDNIVSSPMASPSMSPFEDILASLQRGLAGSRSTVNRVIVPSLLSPAFYPPHAADPQHFLQFVHTLRSMLREHSEHVVAVVTLPTSLFRRSTGLINLAEHMADGVVELQPFPHMMDSMTSLAESGGARAGDEQPQGMLRFHKFPALTERGVNGSAAGRVGDDLTFTLSRRKFIIKPFSLPPMEQDTTTDHGSRAGVAGSGALAGAKKKDIEF